MPGPSPRRRRDAGRRRFRQAELPHADRRQDQRVAGDALSAQARPEPLRSAYRAGNRRAIRKHATLRVAADEIVGAPLVGPRDHDAFRAATRAAPTVPNAFTARTRTAWSGCAVP